MSGIQRKRGRSETQLDEAPDASVAKSLATRSKALDSEEERVVRARTGISVVREKPLERKASGEVLDELLLLEMQLHQRYAAHLARTNAATAKPSPTKAKIIRALRKKN